MVKNNKPAGIVDVVVWDTFMLDLFLQLPAKTVMFWSCYLFFILFFSVHRFFDVPGPIFAKLPHDAVCPEIVYLL